MAVYFGGSRNNQAFPHLPQVVASVITSGQAVHVGCQFGADQAVINAARAVGSFPVVFAVASVMALPNHLQVLRAEGGRVVCMAGNSGGEETPIKARYLLRSIAAFQGCEQAVFFNPGAGSLAVARECVKAGISVHAFGEKPAPIPSCSGAWSIAWFEGLQGWGWGTLSGPTIRQYSLF